MKSQQFPICWPNSTSKATPPQNFPEEHDKANTLLANSIETQPLAQPAYNLKVAPTDNSVWVLHNNPAGGPTFSVVARASLEIIQNHAHVGQHPTQPLVTDERLVTVFMRSNNAAIFDASSGELLRQLLLGDSPMPPIQIGETLWVYNAADDTLQRLNLPDIS